MSYQLVAETSTEQHTTLTTDRHPCHNLSRWVAADLRLRPRCRWERPSLYIVMLISVPGKDSTYQHCILHICGSWFMVQHRWLIL